MKKIFGVISIAPMTLFLMLKFLDWVDCRLEVDYEHKKACRIEAELRFEKSVYTLLKEIKIYK